MQQIKKPIMLKQIFRNVLCRPKIQITSLFCFCKCTKVFRNELEDLMKNDSTFTGNCTFRVSR